MTSVNLQKGEQVAVYNAWLQILRKMLSMLATASGSAIHKVLGVPPISFRASKLNAGFMARIYDAQPDTLTSKILGYATKGWGSAKRKTCISMSEKSIHWSRVKEAAVAGEYRSAYSRHQWIGEMQANRGDARERQGSNASKICNVGPRMDTFLTINEGDSSQRGTKRKMLLWRVGCIPGRPQMCLGCSEYTKATRNHLVKCSEIEAAIMRLCRGLDGHHQLEQGTHTCLDVVLNDKRYIKM